MRYTAADVLHFLLPCAKHERVQVFLSLSLPSGSPTFGCDEAYRSVPFLPAPCSTAAAELAYISIVLLDEFSLIPSLMPPYYVRTRRHTDRQRDSASSFNNDNCTTYTTDAMRCFPKSSSWNGGKDVKRNSTVFVSPTWTLIATRWSAKSPLSLLASPTRTGDDDEVSTLTPHIVDNVAALFIIVPFKKRTGGQKNEPNKRGAL